MPEITLPFELTANTTARASEVMANLSAIASVINGGIEAVNLADLSVSTGKLQDSAVTTPKLNAAAVTTAKLADAAVTGPKLGASAVTEAKLGDLAVSTAKLANLAVTAEKIAADAVTSAKIADEAVQPSQTSFLAHMADNTLLFWARVSGTNGAFIDSGNLPDGWSSSKLGTGLYRITHPVGAANFSIVATTLSTEAEPPPTFASVRQITAGQFDVAVYNLLGGSSKVDSTFTVFVGAYA